MSRVLAWLLLILVGGCNSNSNGHDNGSNNNFLAAEMGDFPDCKVEGRTYCLSHNDYP